MTESRVRVFLADDNLIVREGVRALLSSHPSIEIVGVAADYDELLAGAAATEPQVVVTDIRMPPAFQREGIDAAKEIRRMYPGTGIVILSQYDDPDYAVALFVDGSAAGYAYLLKDRIAEGDQLARAVLEVAAGGSVIDPSIVNLLTRPVSKSGELDSRDEELLTLVAEGRPIKAIAVARRTTEAAASAEVEKLFLTIAQQASTGASAALRRLRMLHEAIVDREEQGETLSRLLPGGLAEKVRREGHRLGQTENLHVTVLMSDVRGYTTIAEHADPAGLARQLNLHRAEMNHAILDAGGTVMQFVGDAVMAVFGAPVPLPDHPGCAVTAALSMHERQAEVNERWKSESLPPFPLGIGLSTGDVAAAMLGSDERIEYTVVGDTVNMAQRLQQFAAGGETVLSEATNAALLKPLEVEAMEPQSVKGRDTQVRAFKLVTG